MVVSYLFVLSLPLSWSPTWVAQASAATVVQAAQPASGSSDAVIDVAGLPPDLNSLHQKIGPKKFAHLVTEADEFLDQLARVVTAFDKRGGTLNPKRTPKVLQKRLSEYLAAFTKAAQAEPSAAADGMLALCQWRLDTVHARDSAEGRKAKGGMTRFKTVLADLKARSVDEHAHFPIHISYLRVTAEGGLENVSEKADDRAALGVSIKNLEKSLPGLVTFAERRSVAVQKNRRTREVVTEALAPMIAVLVEPAG